MNAWLETLMAGTLLGMLYALFGLGLSLSLGVMRMINIAHGDLIVLAAYLGSVCTVALGLDPLTSLVVVIPAMFVIGWLLQTLLLNRVVGRDAMSPLLLTFGLSIVLQNLLQEIFSADTRSLDAGTLSTQSLAIGSLSVGLLPVLIAAVSLVIYTLTFALIRKTQWGRQARAVADDAETSRLVGIDDRVLFALMTGFIFAVIAVAGIFYGIRTPFSPSAGPERLLFAFEAVVLGGLGSVWGTFIGGLIIGIVQVFGAQIHTGLGPFFGHLVFLVVLIARPQGLFSKG
ncbi:MAG: branched-chain amino acid ABC transporter permease [Burkholderiales bacterium]|nr:MAG: branched-chain amino acid ABC transporter permease [Burkholderiales bacterium]